MKTALRLIVVALGSSKSFITPAELTPNAGGSQIPPVKPVAWICEPLKAAC